MREAGPEMGRSTGRSPALQRGTDGPSWVFCLCRLSLFFVFVSPRVPGAERVAESFVVCSWRRKSSCRFGPRLGPALAAWRAACPGRHGRETRQRRLCGGPARPNEECRRGFAGRERGRNQARPRRRSWERGLDGHQGKSLLSFRVFVWMLWRRVL